MDKKDRYIDRYVDRSVDRYDKKNIPGASAGYSPRRRTDYGFCSVLCKKMKLNASLFSFEMKRSIITSLFICITSS